MKADRYNTGKPQWSIVHFKSLLPLVRVLEAGASKYARDNWKKGFDKEVILDSLVRHVTALVDGEEYDPDTKVHHVGAIMCNAMFYSFHFVKDAVKPGTNWKKYLKKLKKEYENTKTR